MAVAGAGCSAGRRGRRRSAGVGAVSRLRRRRTVAAGGAPGATSVPFHGEHQAGIVTPAQDRLHFAAFDVITTEPSWCALLAGVDAGRRADDGRARTPAGTARSAASRRRRRTTPARRSACPPSALTLTIGFGPSLFDRATASGIADRRPAALADLPPFAGDQLDPARSGGDLCIQACAQRPAGRGARRAQPRPDRLRRRSSCAGRSWASAAPRRPRERRPTPRNLFGFKDGTNNLKAEDAGAARRAPLGAAAATGRTG